VEISPRHEGFHLFLNARRRRANKGNHGLLGAHLAALAVSGFAADECRAAVALPPSPEMEKVDPWVLVGPLYAHNSGTLSRIAASLTGPTAHGSLRRVGTLTDPACRRAGFLENDQHGLIARRSGTSIGIRYVRSTCPPPGIVLGSGF